MSTFTINVTYDPQANPPFSFTDDSGHDETNLAHCLKRQTVTWHLVNNHQARNLVIQFTPNDNPFDSVSGTLSPDHEYTFNDRHRASYKYSVSITDSHGHPQTDDPMMSFDDGSILTTGQELNVGGTEVDKIAESARAAWQALFGELRQAIELKADSDGVFFPKGINDVEVDVEFAKIIVKITVKGPA